MFGIGPLELIVVFVIATLIFGPGKIPEFARQLGQFVRSFRKVTGEMTREFTKALDAENLASPGSAAKGKGVGDDIAKSIDNFLGGVGKSGS